MPNLNTTLNSQPSSSIIIVIFVVFQSLKMDPDKPTSLMSTKTLTLHYMFVFCSTFTFKVKQNNDKVINDN